MLSTRHRNAAIEDGDEGETWPPTDKLDRRHVLTVGRSQLSASFSPSVVYVYDFMPAVNDGVIHRDSRMGMHDR